MGKYVTSKMGPVTKDGHALVEVMREHVDAIVGELKESPQTKMNVLNYLYGAVDMDDLVQRTLEIFGQDGWRVLCERLLEIVQKGVKYQEYKKS